MVKCIQYLKQQCDQFSYLHTRHKYHDLTKYQSNLADLARSVAVGDIPHSDSHISADDGVPACHIAFKQSYALIREVATLFVTFSISNTYIFSRPVILM